MKVVDKRIISSKTLSLSNNKKKELYALIGATLVKHADSLFADIFIKKSPQNINK
jgi:hypothetical protein